MLALKELARDREAAKRLLQHWQEAVPNDRMAHLVKDVARAFLRSLQTRLTAFDVQLGHWTFLRILWNNDGLTKRELSIEAGVTEPTTFVALRAMEKLGYITLQQRRNNKKNIYVYLTPEGRALERQLVPLAEDVNEIAMQGISKEDIETTRKTLLVIISNLARDIADSD